jgi:Dolichyl-phosphate-mannose-protein mannosyltransferase
MNHPIRLSLRFFILCTLGTVTLWLALDGKHYWHEIRFMYAASQFSMNDILSGVFNPHQIGGKTDEIGAGGFYLSKVLHISSLKMLFAWLPPDKGGFILAVYTSVLLMGLSGAITYKLFDMQFKSTQQAFLAVCCYLLIPLTPYLAGKILSEVPAFFFIAVSILFFVTGLEEKESVNWVYIIFSGIFLLLAGLARLDIITCYFGYLSARIICSEKENRHKVLKTGSIVLIIFILGEMVAISLLGKGTQYFTRYFIGFIHAGEKSKAMSVIGIMTFGGVMYLLALMATFSKEKKKALPLAVWLLVSAGIEIIITWNYMVEPRYLVSGLLPLAGLAALGLDHILQKFSAKKFKVAWVAALIMAVTFFNVINVRLMPYELDRNAMLKAVGRIFLMDKNATILIPWAYTDYHFLRVMFPDKNIINVHTTGDTHNNIYDESWENRLIKWYGKKYVQSPSILNDFFQNGSVYCLGWGKYPPAEYAEKITKSVGFEKMSRYIGNLPLIDHISKSWIWYSPFYRFQLAGSCGQYRYFKVFRIM